MTKTRGGKALPRLGARGTPIHPWKECKSSIATLENKFLIKLYIYLLYDPAILLLGIHPREGKNLCLQPLHKYLIATLFKTAPTWKQPKCPSSEWLNTHTMKYYSIIKRNKILTDARS